MFFNTNRKVICQNTAPQLDLRHRLYIVRSSGVAFQAHLPRGIFAIIHVNAWKGLSRLTRYRPLQLIVHFGLAVVTTRRLGHRRLFSLPSIDHESEA